jgi:spore coat polysaccharide biosynthesis protein SpsF (cytidylyltransferase family)
MTTVAVIQARCGSTRFPRKVVAPLQGRPMLGHIIERVSRADLVDSVVVATTDRSIDDEVAALAAAHGAGVTRGSEDDVLSRYVLAAHEHAADVIVRITADCPLTDPIVVNSVISARADEDADYASNVDPPTFPEGYDCEVFTLDCLHRLDRMAIAAYLREHVTAAIREQPALFRIARIACEPDLSWIRLTVDVPEDLVRVSRLLSDLPSSPPPDLAAVVAAFERDTTLHDQSRLPIRNERYHAQRDAAQRSKAAGMTHLEG